MANPEVLFITLKYLGNQRAIRLLADKFDRADPSIWNAMALVCQFLFKHQARFIKQSTESEMPYIASKFNEKCGFHIPFYPLVTDQKPYRNYKNSSFVIMAIIPFDGTFSTFLVDSQEVPTIVTFSFVVPCIIVKFCSARALNLRYQR